MHLAHLLGSGDKRVQASTTLFIINVDKCLVGRSIPDDRLEDINQGLEGDIMVRQVYDVKGIDMGNGVVR